MNIRLVPKSYFLLGTLLLTACQMSSLLPVISPAPSSAIKVQQTDDKVQLELNLSSQAGNTVKVKDGAAFQLYKEDKLLVETVVNNNQVKFTPVDMPPPYRYSMPDATVIETLLERGAIPIDTQGGLLPNETAKAGAQPLINELPKIGADTLNTPALGVSPPPKTPFKTEERQLKIEGTITEDLRVAKVAKITKPLAIAQLPSD